ncbi:hypothetical protein M0802_006105 [Mischocyttarus mexicanus]|nr:hypothetical protein M0802_006105 [Mischocyttarus mexicanus]
MASITMDITVKNIEKQYKNARSIFYKKPINKYNWKLEVDNIWSPQEIRRQELLEIQRKNRNNTFNAGRDELEIFKSDDENEEHMEIEHNNKRWRKYERCKHYANQFMLSEWMFETPKDILEKWIMVPCPEGKRTLLIAHKHVTKAFDKRGNRIGQFQSLLPGGNYSENKNHCTILDCLWIASRKMYYVLDVLAWSNICVLNCDTDFRFFWLKSKFEEIEGLENGDNDNNKYPMLLLPHIKFDCDLQSSLEDLFKLAPLDGLLFYHREGLYTKGQTPLVTWLKSFMLPEMLGISLPSPFDEKPDGYIDARHYILSFMKKKNAEAFITTMDIVDEEHEITQVLP